MKNAEGQGSTGHGVQGASKASSGLCLRSDFTEHALKHLSAKQEQGSTPFCGGGAEGARTPWGDVTRQLGGWGGLPWLHALSPLRARSPGTPAASGPRSMWLMLDADLQWEPRPRHSKCPQGPHHPQGLQSLKPNSKTGHPEPHGLDSRLTAGTSVKGGTNRRLGARVGHSQGRWLARTPPQPKQASLGTMPTPQGSEEPAHSQNPSQSNADSPGTQELGPCWNGNNGHGGRARGVWPGAPSPHPGPSRPANTSW